MKIINIIGDSLSMVRPADSIFLEDLYWVITQRLLGTEYYVINNSRRNNDLISVAKNADDDIFNRRCDSIVFFIGIVDCFPRLFGRQTHYFLSLLPMVGLGFVTRTITRLASRNRYFLTKQFPKVYVSIAQAETILRNLIEQVQAQQVTERILLLGVLSTNDQARNRNFGVDGNILARNQLYERIAAQYPDFVHYINIDLALRSEDFDPILIDGHHISKEAHLKLAQFLSTVLK